MPRLICALSVMPVASLLVTISASADEKAAAVSEPISPEEPIELFNGEDLPNWTFDIGGKDTKPEESYRVKVTEARIKGRRTINYTDDSEKEVGEWNTMIVQTRGDTLKVSINIEYRKIQIKPIQRNDLAC